jgi:hypothetical protein
VLNKFNEISEIEKCKKVRINEVLKNLFKKKKLEAF